MKWFRYRIDHKHRWSKWHYGIAMNHWPQIIRRWEADCGYLALDIDIETSDTMPTEGVCKKCFKAWEVKA